MKQKSIEQGVREMLMNNNIPNKVSAVKTLVKLNIISASADINDDDEGDDNQGGGGHSNYNQYGNGGPHFKKGKKYSKLKDSDIGKKVAVAGVRELLEGIGAQNQCNAAIGSIKDIPRIKCYICGQLGGMPNMKTMECEHIFCVGLAAQYFGLLRATSFSKEQKLVLSILYAWAHRCCNQLKSNLSFMTFKGDPNNGFEFHEANAKELLRNIYDNTDKYDCEWVDKLIKKVYPDKQRFITARTAVLGRYCRPLIEQINEVRTRLFHFSPDLFSFMSILKIAATTLVLLTGEKNETQLKLKAQDARNLIYPQNPEDRLDPLTIKKVIELLGKTSPRLAKWVESGGAGNLPESFAPTNLNTLTESMVELYEQELITEQELVEGMIDWLGAISNTLTNNATVAMAFGLRRTENMGSNLKNIADKFGIEVDVVVGKNPIDWHSISKGFA